MIHAIAIVANCIIFVAATAYFGLPVVLPLTIVYGVGLVQALYGHL